MAGLAAKYAKLGLAKGWAKFRQDQKQKKAQKRIAKENKVHAKKSPRPKGLKLMAPPISSVVKRKGSGMKISKERLEALKSAGKKALARARNSAKVDGPEVASAVGLGIAGGVGTSFLIGMIPVPATLPKPGAIKSGVQCGLGVAAALTFKNKYVRYAGFGAAILGGVGVIREFMAIPTFAGEVDQSMFGEMLEGQDYGQPELMGAPLGGAPLGGEPLSGNSFQPY